MCQQMGVIRQIQMCQQMGVIRLLLLNTDHSGIVVSTTLSSLGQCHFVGLTSACSSVCADQAYYLYYE